MRRVADASSPFDYSILPDDVGMVLGYVGGAGHTPHLWTVDEIAAVGRAGLEWRAIWVPPQRALIPQDGTDAAAGMIAALRERNYPVGLSVFLDIEYSSYWANPGGAEGAARAWKAGMAAAGWPYGYWYGPHGSLCDWLARWTGIEPSSIPAGLIGVQYDHALAGDRYDISVFDEALWTREDPPDMTPDEHDMLAQVAKFVADIPVQDGTKSPGQTVGAILPAVRKIYNQANVILGAESHEAAAIAGIAAAVQAGGIDTEQAASEIADVLKTILPDAIVTELAARLAG